MGVEADVENAPEIWEKKVESLELAEKVMDTGNENSANVDEEQKAKVVGAITEQEIYTSEAAEREDVTATVSTAAVTAVAEEARETAVVHTPAAELLAQPTPVQEAAPETAETAETAETPETAETAETAGEPAGELASASEPTPLADGKKKKRCVIS